MHRHTSQGKGHRLLAEINIIRGLQNLDPIGRIAINATAACACPECVLARAAACIVRPASSPLWPRALVLVCNEDIARQVAAAIDQPHDGDAHEVLATEAMDSLILAMMYELVFIDAAGFLRGWVEPTDADPSTWDVHLMPGYLYPPGHAPRDHHELIS